MEWIENTKSKTHTEFDSEVIVYQILKKKEKNFYKVVFKFLKNSAYKIVPDGEYIVLAKDGSRIYFKQCKSQHGFKLMSSGATVKYFEVKTSVLNLDESVFGEYNLEYDSSLGLHYIDFNRKFSQELSWKGKI